MIELRQLLAILPDWTSPNLRDVSVSSVTDRVAEVGVNDVFVAIAGTNFDGATVIEQACKQGAVAVVVNENVDVPSHVITIIVHDTRLALALLLRETMVDVKQALKTLTWIGITGTNGKTSTATLLEQLLNASGKNTALIGTTGNGYRAAGRVMQWMDTAYTTPHARDLYELALLFVQAEVTHVVMEVSSHGLHQHRVSGIELAGAIFTNLTRDHLDYHGTMENYADAKRMLFTNLGEHGIALVSGMDSHAQMMLQHCKAASRHIVHAEHLVISPDGAEFVVCMQPSAEQPDNIRDNVEFGVRTSLMGEFNAINAALACAMAKELGISESRIAELAPYLKPPKGRMERFELRNGAIAVVDYAHTPDALEKALLTLRPHTSVLTLVFGCGGDRDTGKRPLMGALAQSVADVVWVTSDNPRSEDPSTIINDILCGMTSQHHVHVEVDRATAIRSALHAAVPGGIVLIAGKGHEQYQEVHGVRTHFSDQEIVCEFLAATQKTQ